MLRKRSIFLFVILIVLMGLTLVLTTIEEQSGFTYDDDTLFSLQNVSDIDRVVMEGIDTRKELIKDHGTWRLKGKYDVDPKMINVLLAALNEVRIKRPVPVKLSKRIADDLERKGINVKVYEGDQLVSNFLAGGDAEKKESYFVGVEGGPPMIVYIPGYDSYVSGIFELKEADWRNKVIFNSNWTSLQSLNVAYPDEPSNNFEINFKDNFFQMPEIGQVDTAKMMSYIELFNYIEAENYLELELHPEFDSLIKSEPIVKIDLKDMNPKKNNSLQLFRPVNEDQTILGMVDNGQLAVIKYPKVQNLLKKKADFQKK